jgi:uncharacterized protein YukE
VVTSFGDSLPATNQESLDQAVQAVPTVWQAPDVAPPQPNFQARPVHVKGVASQPAVGSGFTVETPQLTNVAGAMGSDQSTAQSGLNTLNNEGPLAALVAAGWDQSNNLGANAENAYYGISALTSKLLSSYEDMSAYLRKAATGYNDADDSASGAARSIDV